MSGSTCVHFGNSLNKYLLGIYYVPGTALLGAGATLVNKTAKDPSSWGADHRLEKTDSTQNKPVNNLDC